MTIPNRALGRAGYAVGVAAVAFVWQFVFFKPNALLWALFLCSPLVPLVDRLWPAPKAQWVPAPAGSSGRA